jgi:hypothetical protein
MSIEIDVISSGVPDVRVAARMADLILGHCLNAYVPLGIEYGSDAVTLKSADIWLTAISDPEAHREFSGEYVVSVRAERRNPRSYLACLIVSSASAYCFSGRFDLDNWITKSTPEPVKILAECLRYENCEASWLLERAAEAQ